MAKVKHYWDYEMEDIPFEDWDILAQDEWYEAMELRAIEHYERNHGIDE